jgi:hypothetical protein
MEYAARMLRLACALSLLFASSCAELKQIANQPGAVKPNPPKVVVAEVTLASQPTPMVLARALCPRVAPAPVCMVLGGQPSPAELAITFAVQLDITNPNSFPLPLVEALVAFSAYPGATGGQNLGAVCLSMCEDPSNCPPRADACTGGGPEIKTMNDFAAASAGFLVAVATGQARADNLKVKTLPANGTARATIALALDPPQVVALVARLGGDALDQVKRGSAPTFVIPWEVQGTAWVTVQNFGKLAAGFGPTQGRWEIK